MSRADQRLVASVAHLSVATKSTTEYRTPFLCQVPCNVEHYLPSIRIAAESPAQVSGLPFTRRPRLRRRKGRQPPPAIAPPAQMTTCHPRAAPSPVEASAVAEPEAEDIGGHATECRLSAPER
jgi:hypothetical protein